MSGDRYAVAQDVARHAGALALAHFRNRDRLVVELKGPQDFVSRADRDVEASIRAELAAAFPDDRFLGEETAGEFEGAIDRCWVVDPIDGTHNFLRGVPYWNVAIAYVVAGRAEIGVVYDPVADDLHHAQRGGGAWCDTASGRSGIRCANTSELRGAYVALGHHDRAPDPRYLELRARMMERGVSMRNFGSAALQLAHVARGRLDAFIELQLSIWDAIGGLLLVEEAGGYAAPFAPASSTAKAACMACAAGIAGEVGELVGQEFRDQGPGFRGQRAST
ncbi:MAG TPA: inositol monophosphatase [Casimicrobiaceae bacterium]|nr:inositol monophosphatase [Casimicrobiaceae bacterium]